MYRPHTILARIISIERAPFTLALHFQRCVAGSPGRIHPRRVGCSFSA